MTYLMTDNFAGKAGAAPNPKHWSYQPDKTAGEVQTYTNSRANSYLDGQGHLVIRADKVSGSITSARLATRGLAELDWGTFTARIQLQQVRGTWPAFWLLGHNSQLWPMCGELDVFEWYGNGQWAPQTTIHTGSNNVPAQDVSVASTIKLDQAFHDWQVKIDRPGNVSFFKDGVRYMRAAANSMPNWPFGQGKPLYLLLNIAVGGDGGGVVPANFAEAKMLVDSVSIWQ